jgi:hypothetical protein
MERRRLGETEERPVMPRNGGQVDELVDLSGGTQRSGQWSGRSGEGEAEECKGGCDAAREMARFGEGEGRPGPTAAYMRRLPTGGSNGREAPRRINGREAAARG